MAADRLQTSEGGLRHDRPFFYDGAFRKPGGRIVTDNDRRRRPIRALESEQHSSRSLERYNFRAADNPGLVIWPTRRVSARFLCNHKRVIMQQSAEDVNPPPTPPPIALMPAGEGEPAPS